jgi:hypothetical protein
MFLAGVEQHPQPSPFCNVLRAAPAAGTEYPQIWNLFAYRPQAGEHLARVHPGDHARCRPLLSAPARVNRGARQRRGCIERAGGLENSRLEEKEKALFRFIEKEIRDPPRFTTADMRRSPLFSRLQSVLYSISTSRWIDTTGVHEMSPGAHREGGKRTSLHGYDRK